MDIHKLKRKQVRYWCFRFRTAVTGGASAEGAPLGLKEYFEGLESFRILKEGWKNFAVSWDLPHQNGCTGDPCECASTVVPLIMMPRKFSVWEEWNATIRQESPVHPAFYKGLDD